MTSVELVCKGGNNNKFSPLLKSKHEAPAGRDMHRHKISMDISISTSMSISIGMSRDINQVESSFEFAPRNCNHGLY